MAEHAKRVLSESGLSVTALNHFLNCPSEFLYKSILKLPEAPSASAEKGNAMHEALAAIWALPERALGRGALTAKKAAETIVESVRAYMSRSLLPANEKSAVLKALVEDAPAVAKALLPHFAQEGAVATESWAETTFESSYQGAQVAVRLHGKLDAVVEGQNAVSVFDYKTRAAMSPAAIRGETKTAAAQSNGGYFRQLVFYRMLLEGGKHRGKAIEPALVFVKPDDKGRCPIIALPIEKADIERVRGEIASLVQSVWSGDVVSADCGEADCMWCKLKKLTN
jgi:DNA helicase-2/ATP-dependent DNA helicase PcrA